MDNHIELASRTLFDPSQLHVRDVKLFPGSDREITAAQMAEQVNRAISQMMDGDVEEVSF